MADVSRESILNALKVVKYPGFSRDIVSFGLIREVEIVGGAVKLHMSLTTNEPAISHAIEEECSKVLGAMEGVKSVSFDTEIKAPVAAAMQAGGGLPQNPIPGVKQIIAVASGKGGVGKSTVAANLAMAFHQSGLKTGLCDCDLYGPSMGVMFGTNERPFADEQDRIIPLEKYGIRLMSMGFLLSDDAPAVLRGPMVTRYTQQFLRNVVWGDLDMLVLDLPPGTGDIQLTVVQTVALTGAIVVTTPQEVALIDARKAVSMFAKVNVRVLGIVENMSYFQIPGEEKRHDLFGNGGGRKEAESLGVPFLGEIPLEPEIRISGDAGMPIVSKEPAHSVSKIFLDITQQLMERK